MNDSYSSGYFSKSALGKLRTNDCRETGLNRACRSDTESKLPHLDDIPACAEVWQNRKGNQAPGSVGDPSTPVNAAVPYVFNPVRAKREVRRLWCALPTISLVTEGHVSLSVKQYSY